MTASGAEPNEPTNEKTLSWAAVAAGFGVGFIGALICLSAAFALYMALRLDVDFVNLEDTAAFSEKLEQAFSRDLFGLAAVFFSIAGLFSFLGGYVAGKIGKNAPRPERRCHGGHPFRAHGAGYAARSVFHRVF